MAASFSLRLTFVYVLYKLLAALAYPGSLAIFQSTNLSQKQAVPNGSWKIFTTGRVNPLENTLTNTRKRQSTNQDTGHGFQPRHLIHEKISANACAASDGRQKQDSRSHQTFRVLS